MSSISVIGSLVSLPGVERFGWMLMHSLWQFALVALFVSVIVREMRCSPATMRYGVLVVGLIVSTVAPVATWLLLPTPAVEQSTSRAISAADSAELARPPAQNPPGVDQSPFTGDPSLEKHAKDAAIAGPFSSPALDRAARETPTALETAMSPLQRIRSVMRPWLGWIVAAWSLGVVVCSLRPLLGWYTLRRLRRLATSAASDEVLAAARRLSQQLGLRRVVQVLYSTLAQVPVVFGYLRPVILLPVSLATSVPIRQLEAILAHELAHVQRHDFLVNLLQTLVETLFFYHPGIWWLSRRIRIEREHCCDDVAVSLLGNRAEYGRALLAIEESRRQSSILALGAGGSSLLSRIRRIVNTGADRNVSSLADRWPLALLGLAVVAAMGLISMYRTVEAEDGAPAGKPANAAGKDKEKAVGVDAGAEPARLRIRNWDGSAAQLDEVVEAKVGFPKSSPGGWVGYATREGDVPLVKLSEGTHWLLAGGSVGRPIPFKVTMPAAQPVLEQRLRNDRNWMRNDIEIKTTVKADDKVGDVIVISVRNKSKKLLVVSEQDVQILAAIKDEPIRGLSPQWQSADFKPIKIEPEKSGELRLNWREWARKGLWSTRMNEVMAEPTLPRPEHGKIWVRVCIDGRGPDLLTDGSDLVAVADPMEIVPDPAKKIGAVTPAADEYQSASYLQKKLSAKIPDAAWGKARDGLRLALVVRDPNNSEWNDLPAATSIPFELKVRPGDEVRCQLVIENVGDRGVNFTAYSYSEVGRDVKVLDRAGSKVDIQTTFLSIPVIAGHWRLLPGERFLLQMPPINFVDKQPEQGVGYSLSTSSGEYTLQCGYTLGDLSADAIKPVARTAEWTGDLTTSALKVTVSDSPESDKKSPNNQLGHDNARTAEDSEREQTDKASDANALPKAGADAKNGAVAGNGEIVGRLIDSATGKPVAGATIACGAIINDSGKGGGANAITDAEGRYRLAVPSPGIYNVWLKKFDKDPLMTAAADDGIRVEAGKIATSQLNLIVGRKVTGKVVDSTGKTFAKMTVYCYSSARPQSGGVQSTETKADGSFEFALPPGRAQVYVIEKDEKHPDIPFATSRSAETYIQVPAEGDIPPLTLTLEGSQPKFGDPKWLKRSTPGTQIMRREGNQDVTGTVVGEDGKPIAGAKVFPEDGPSVSTNDKGEFRVATLKGTQLVMHAVAPGYHAWFGTPTSGDILKIVLESKQPPRAGQGSPPPARNPRDAAAPAGPDAAEPAARNGEVEKAVLKILRTPFKPDPAKGSWQDGAYEAQVLLSLWQLQHHDIVVKALLRVVDRTEPTVPDQRRLAMTYLGAHAPAQVIPLVMKELESVVRIPAEEFTAHEEVVVLGRIGERARDAMPVLIKVLDSQDWVTRGEAIEALVKIGPSSSDVIEALAKHFDDPRAVYQAANYGELAKPLGPSFIKLLDSKSKAIRIWAAYGLVRSSFDEPRGFDVLIGEVAAGIAEERSLAATALAALGNQAKSMISKLRTNQSDADERVAKEVREAIHRIETDDRILTHAEQAAKAAAARTAAEKALWHLDGNR